jgi:uncharacterized protein (TIGR02466 family)|tara:strand:- start:486 stop:1091 length:606 start_codon:yes stop_codon:yes gene_type:complete
MSSVTNPLFGKGIYSNTLDINTKNIVSMIDTARKPCQVEVINSGKKSLYVLEEDKFKFLKDIILKEFYSYAYDEMKYINKFEITTSWFTQVDKNESSQFHNHSNCFISGVLYLQTLPNCGDIVFQDFNNTRFALQTYENNILNSKQWMYTPNEGLILFFPSEVYHKVEENKSKHTRYSLAFNIIPVGLIGDETTDSHTILK